MTQADSGRKLGAVEKNASSVCQSESKIDLYWLPLGAGGRFVRFNGRVYEAFKARRERRSPLDLYHSALVVTVPEGRFVIENAWPIPAGNGAARGVAVEGPVGSRHFGGFRALRYEIRCWQDGVIADIDEAVDSPRLVSRDEDQAHRLLQLVGSVPPLMWGRDELHVGEMWNSNSVVSWLLARSGLKPEELQPPHDGRAPGWRAGVCVAALCDTEESLTHQSAAMPEGGPPESTKLTRVGNWRRFPARARKPDLTQRAEVGRQRVSDLHRR